MGRPRIALAHLARRVAQAHDPGAHLADERFRNDKSLAKRVVEANRQIAGQLDMLLLVLAHGHELRTVKQDIRRHQRRVGEQPNANILALAAGLVLKLRHATQLPHIR